MNAYHYIIAVHGMGESRYGETVLPVISRCAEVIPYVLGLDKAESSDFSKSRDIVTLGMFAGESPHKNSKQPWVEFEGIPVDDSHAAPFTGVTSHAKDGKLIRFVDIWWKDLIDKNEAVLEPVSPWADGLLGRISRLNVKTPPWMPQLLLKLQDVLGPLQTIMRSRKPDVEDLAFNKYLGDVQIYAEYEPMRGQAVRRFHDRMAEVCNAHYASLPEDLDPAHQPAPQFTILAHSLGSIMSLDALMYGHRQQPESASDTANLPFPGYEHEPSEKEKMEPADTSWIRHVKNFITLGSPIDKFLLFWPHRYQYLNTTDWMDQDIAGRPPIQHINYCDEQDPVGQSLDVLRSTQAYQHCFTASFPPNHILVEPEPIEPPLAQIPVINRVTRSVHHFILRDSIGDKNNEFDVVYRRSIWPGIAHTSYWKDKDLFKNLLEHILLGKKGSITKPNVVSDKRGMYIWITLLTYFVIPLALAAVVTMLYDMLLEPESWKGYLLASLTFIVAGWFARSTLNLMVWWRQLLRNKRSREVVPQSALSIIVKWGVRLGLPFLALAFFQVALNTSDNYVTSIHEHVVAKPDSVIAADSTSAITKWPETPTLVKPFLLISGLTQNDNAFWTSLLSLLVLFSVYRIRFSNFRESNHYEGSLGLGVDFFVVAIGYGILSLMWHKIGFIFLVDDFPWTSSVGLLSLLVLMGWHLRRAYTASRPSKKNIFLQKFQEIFLSVFVFLVLWFLLGKASHLIAEYAPNYMSPEARKRMVYFCFTGGIIWFYMALRFFVAKVQLGSDKVPPFAAYFGGGKAS